MARDNPFTKLRQNAWIIPPRRSTESLLAESGQSEWHAPYYGLSLTTEPEAMENDPDQLDVQVQEIPRPIQSHENPFTRQGRAFELPIILGRRRKARPDCLRKRIRAVYDTGSEIDAIALDLVWKHDGRMQRLHQTPLVQLANGATLPVIGLVNLWCSFAKGPRGMIKRTFNVFKEIASDVQLVMGRHFLEQTGTLTKYRSRLRECTPKLYKYPRIFSFTVPKRRFCCYLNSQLVYAVADTGSQVDLISPELANALDLDIRSVSDNERYVLLPGNIEAQVIGKTTVNFHTPNISARMLQSSPAGLPEKDHELVGRAAQGLSSPNRSKWNVKIPSIPIGDISRPWTEDVPLTPSSRSKDERRSDKTHVILSPASSQHPFYVLPSLTNNVVLGEELLDSIDAFGRFRDCFFDIKEDVAINSPDMFSIKWMKDWEKRLLGRKNQTSNWPPPYSSIKKPGNSSSA